jgi:D-ribulokinase
VDAGWRQQHRDRVDRAGVPRRGSRKTRHTRGRPSADSDRALSTRPLGGRFPFRRPGAEGFTIGIPADRIDAFAAGLEGVALLERLAYETLSEIGAAVGDRVHATGGGARSNIWLRLRASVLGRTLLRPAISETAMGAALLAASGVWFGTLSQAARAMVRIGEVVHPDPDLKAAYDDAYEVFVTELRRRGYLPKGTG